MAKSFDAQFVRHWAALSLELLKQHRTELNALNVFPVPDGDTGTNLYLSFQSAVAAEAQRTSPDADLIDAWRTLARGALLGARGNSGVILASVLSAIALEVEKNPACNLQQLLQVSAAAARLAVHNPVEGTALSVLDAAANAANSRPELLAQTARAALAKTPEQLPALKEAGVVDAGGRGVVLLLDALVAAGNGQTVASPATGFVPLVVPTAINCSDDAKFELMFLVPSAELEKVKSKCAQVGSSLVITAGAESAQVHLHLDSPNELLEDLKSIAQISNIKLELLDQAPRQRRMIAPVFGNKLAEQLLSNELIVISAEPNQHPSVQDFVSAGIKANCDELVLMSSDADTLSVVELAATELNQLGVVVGVVATLTMPETLAAISVYSAEPPISLLVEQMNNVAADVQTFAVARAQRVAKTLDLNAQIGDWVLVQNRQLISANPDIFVLLSAISNFANAELVTVLVGEEFAEDLLPQLRNLLETLAPLADLQILLAGQQVWSLLIGVE